jgi:AraC family transcriptional regulator of adaptative response/methylated-DNA-[protein]-cysteine methyltransferase
MSVAAVAAAVYATDETRWQAVQARDANADGHFVYAVRTTGIYCRPSSSARCPKRENVLFFDSAAEAEAAGFSGQPPSAGRS